MAEAKKFIYPASDAQINNWKSRHNGVYAVSVVAEDKDGKPIEVHGYFSKPDLKVIGAMGRIAQEDPIRAASVMFESCKISVDPLMESNDEIKLAAQTQVASLFKYYGATVKKL